MSLFKRGNIWHYEFEFGCARIRGTTKTRNREVAGRIERERRRNLELGIAGLGPLSGPVTMSKAVEAFRDENEPRWGARTHQIHVNSWRHLKEDFGKLLLVEVQSKHIGRYQRKRQENGASSRTINIEVGLIRMVMIKHRIWQNISPDVHMLREREDVGRALAADEEQRILAAAKTSISRSLYPAVLLSIHTGMRNHELRLLKWKQIDLAKEEIRVGKSKTQGGTGRVIPLSARATSCLTEWQRLFPDSKLEHFIFPTEKYKLNKLDAPGASVQVYNCDPSKPTGGWSRAWQTCRRVAKVSARWHDLRHTFVSRMGDGMVSEQTLMSMTGHLSRKTLERYSHARMEAKRAAVKTLDSAPMAETPSMHPQNSPQSEISNSGMVN